MSSVLWRCVSVPQRGRVVIRASVDLLQVESSAAARSVRLQRTAVCRNAQEIIHHCAEMNSHCHDPRQPGVSFSFPPPLFWAPALDLCITIVMPVPSRDTQGRLSCTPLRFASCSIILPPCQLIKTKQKSDSRIPAKFMFHFLQRSSVANITSFCRPIDS